MGQFKRPQQSARGTHNALDVGGVIKALESDFEHRDGAFGSSSLESFDVGFESFDDLSESSRQDIDEMFSHFQDLAQRCGLESFDGSRSAMSSDSINRVHENQISAAALIASAGVGSSSMDNYRRAIRQVSEETHTNDPNVIMPNISFDGPAGTIPVVASQENYNEKPTRDFRVISVAYNLSAARQDAFGESIYPMVVVNPTEGGVTQNLTYAAVMQDVYHDVTGAVFDTKEVNMVEAYRDPSVLEDASTKIIPVVDQYERNTSVFVDPNKIAPYTVEMERGGSVTTAPLRMGTSFDLMALSNRQQLINANVLTIEDTIDPSLRLSRIYVELGDGKIVSFRTERLPTATFQPQLIGDTRGAILNFITEDLVLRGDTETIDGSTSSPITELRNRGWTLRLGAVVNGRVMLSKGNTQIHAVDLTVERLFNANGDSLDTSEGQARDVVDALGQMKVIGYDLDARFTNTNRRERGQLVQTRTKQFRYPIPLQAPITLPMSTMDENGPGEVVKTLTVATNIRNSNNAVIRLLNYLAQLRDVVTNGYDKPKFGAVEGALSVMIRPTYAYERLDLRGSLDTLRSQDRYADVSQTILNAIKAKIYPAYRNSNIEAAFQTVTGNADEKPKFIIATDKEIANYLMVIGDDRTLGPNLKYEIVSTNNILFDGKIVVIPTRENPAENDILNFGQFYYVPTIVADLPISRNGQISREIAAIPYNLHVNNIPFAIEFDVVGLAEVMSESSNQRLPGYGAPEGDGSDGGVDSDNGTTVDGDTQNSGNTGSEGGTTN